jgi:hypothetical protein
MSKPCQQLQELLDKVRRELDAHQQQIREAETSYLKDTAGFGSLSKGWDNLLNKQVKAASYSMNRQVASSRQIKESERIFSRSSADSKAPSTDLDVSPSQVIMSRRGTGKVNQSASKRLKKRDDEDTDFKERF